MPNSLTNHPVVTTQKHERSIAVLSLLGISCYLVLRFILNISPDVYSLTVNADLTTGLARLYQGKISFSTTLLQAPLLAVLVVGGVPLLYQLSVKLVKGDFGADLLAGISIITAVLLHEYLAGSLVVLMLSGGAALEHYDLGVYFRQQFTKGE